jgi:two-component system cell cycle sensor histidine kinase/response regulator CckA
MAHLLIVEDNAELRVAMTQLLTDHAHTVIAAANGVEAMDAISRPRLPDLVILDLVMPSFSGWEFLAEMRSRSHCARVPVLVASAFAAPPNGLEVQAFIQKPYDGDEFLAVVNRLVAAGPLTV